MRKKHSHSHSQSQRSSLAREEGNNIHHAIQEMGTQINFGRDFVEVKGEKDIGDLHDPSHSHLPLTARAA